MRFTSGNGFTPTNVHNDTLITVSEMGYPSDALSLAWLGRLPIHGGLEHIDGNSSTLQRSVSTIAISTILAGRFQAPSVPKLPRRERHKPAALALTELDFQVHSILLESRHSTEN